MARFLKGSRLRLFLIGTTAVTSVGFYSHFEQKFQSSDSNLIIQSNESKWKNVIFAESNSTLTQIQDRLKVLSSSLGKSYQELLTLLPHLSNGAEFDKLQTQYSVRPNEKLSGDQVASYIDHTVLKAVASGKDIEQLCNEAHQNHFYAVCVNPSRISLAVTTLGNLKSDVKVAGVVGFPLGATTKESKAFEAQQIIKNGGNEVDMVLNIGALMDKDFRTVFEDVKAVVDASKQVNQNAVVKVILETGYLTKEQIIDASLLSVLAGATFVKTSTGFGQGGAKVEDVQLMKLVVGNKALVKASGGVRSLVDATQMVQVGAARIGTSSGISIIKETKATSDY